MEFILKTTVELKSETEGELILQASGDGKITNISRIIASVEGGDDTWGPLTFNISESAKKLNILESGNKLILPLENLQPKAEYVVNVLITFYDTTTVTAPPVEFNTLN